MSVPSRGRKILFIRRPGIANAAIEVVLESEDYRCVSFASVAEARAELETLLIDAVILSLDLLGSEVAGVARLLKEEHRGMRAFLPVMIIGDRGQLGAQSYEFGGSVDDFVVTPVASTELLLRLSSLLERQESERALLRENASLRAEQERRRALAQLVVHDLRNPISAMVGNVFLLQDALVSDEPNPDPLVKQCLGDLDALNERALRMLAGLLDVEDLEDGRLVAEIEAVELRGFATRIAGRYSGTLEARNLRLDLQCSGELEACFDRKLVGRVLENLLDNSMRYAPVRGRVFLGARAEGGDLFLEVGNAGLPIPAEEHARMFQRYYRIEGAAGVGRENRGLGLYFCRLAAQAHGGDISVESRPELSVCFVLHLPKCVVGGRPNGGRPNGGRPNGGRPNARGAITPSSKGA